MPPADKIITFETQQEIDDFRTMLAEYRRNKGKTLKPSVTNEKEPQERYTDIFIVKPINDITGISGDTPSGQLLDLYRLDGGVLKKIAGFSGSKKGFNIDATTIRKSKYSVALKNNFGEFVVIPICCGDEEEKTSVQDLISDNLFWLDFDATTDATLNNGIQLWDNTAFFGFTAANTFPLGSWTYEKNIQVMQFFKAGVGDTTRQIIQDNPSFEARLKFLGSTRVKSNRTYTYDSGPMMDSEPFDIPAASPTVVKLRLLSGDADSRDRSTWDDAELASVDIDLSGGDNITGPFGASYRELIYSESGDPIPSTNFDITSILQAWADNPQNAHPDDLQNVYSPDAGSSLAIFFEPTWTKPSWTHHVDDEWSYWGEDIEFFVRTDLPTQIARIEILI